MGSRSQGGTIRFRDRELGRAIDRVARNRTEGAHALAETGLDVLEAAVRRWERRSLVDLRAATREVSRSFRTVQPAMGIFDRWATEWRAQARASRPPSAGRLHRWVARWRKRLAVEPARIRAVAERSIRPSARVVTISHSSTVGLILSSLRGPKRPIAVVVLESRPGGEGRALARDLARSGLAVDLIPDREGVRAVGEADLLLIGADTVYGDGSVLHKVGTRPLALAARRAGCPVIVAAGTSKFVTRSRPRGPVPARFDRTPRSAVAEYWTDIGRLSGAAVGAGRRAHVR